MEMIKDALFLGIIGMLSTGIGGLVFSFIKVKNKFVLASLYEITAGIMTGVVCFGMMHESINFGGIFPTIIGVFLGVILVIGIEFFTYQKNDCGSISIVISMAVHNIVEGLAIGTSYLISNELGLAVLISIAFHNIPEGMVVGILNKKKDKVDLKPVLSSMIVGAFLGVGGIIGGVVGSVSTILIAVSLSIASGAMLYIVACDLIPSSKSIVINKKIALLYIVGIIIGIFIVK